MTLMQDIQNWARTYIGKLLTSSAEMWAVSGAGGAIASFFLPTLPFLIMAFALSMVDLITGVWAAQKRKDVISSKRLRDTLRKVAAYFAVILLSEGMVFVFGVPHAVTYVLALVICIAELKSNIENAEVISGKRIWESIKNFFNLPSQNGGRKN